MADCGCSGQNSFSFRICINDFRFGFSFRIFIFRAVKDKDNERRRQEQLARERLEAARLRKKEGRKPQGDDGQLSVIASDLEVEEDVLKLQEMALTSLDLKHQSERELLMTVSLAWVVATSLFLYVSPSSDAGLKIDNLDCIRMSLLLKHAKWSRRRTSTSTNFTCEADRLIDYVIGGKY